LYLLLPLSFVFALVLAGQGVIQNFDDYREVRTLAAHPQTLPMGPVASQEAIKELGTNGGGFFNANSAHPFENPTPLTNLLEIISMLLIPFALTVTFGRMVGDGRQGRALMIGMLILFALLANVAFLSEQGGNPRLGAAGIDATAGVLQPGGNMEGKEVRFGITASTLFAAATTATSTGAVDAMHDSFTPMGGFAPLLLMQFGELVPGGVGTGLYTILVFAILGVFIAGLMIGRTPEYLGKKIESREMKLASVFILVTPFVVLLGTAAGVTSGAGVAGVANPGAHGFSEILYAFTSAGNNNGSCFCGLSANTPFYNLALGIVMWIGRFWPIVATLAIAEPARRQEGIPVTEGTMLHHGPCQPVPARHHPVTGVLNYAPALALGPVVEHYLLLAHRGRSRRSGGLLPLLDRTLASRQQGDLLRCRSARAVAQPRDALWSSSARCSRRYVLAVARGQAAMRYLFIGVGQLAFTVLFANWCGKPRREAAGRRPSSARDAPDGHGSSKLSIGRDPRSRPPRPSRLMSEKDDFRAGRRGRSDPRDGEVAARPRWTKARSRANRRR
ncbi:MAG: potassium-transporting ATPase subunit KdpA, partial [Steroidobacteraceae bacterium]